MGHWFRQRVYKGLGIANTFLHEQFEGITGHWFRQRVYKVLGIANTFLHEQFEGTMGHWFRQRVYKVHTTASSFQHKVKWDNGSVNRPIKYIISAPAVSRDSGLVMT